jgi:hypothetical protein
MHYVQTQFPILKHVPDWFPGTAFKQKAKEWSIVFDAVLNQPFEVARRDMVCSLICDDILSTKPLFSHPITRRLGSSYLRSYLKAYQSWKVYPLERSLQI